jgi:hypothetical protein
MSIPVQRRVPVRVWLHGIICLSALATCSLQFKYSRANKNQGGIFSISSLEKKVYYYDNPAVPVAAKSTSSSELPKKEGFGACLLILDDTILLKEWLAYHFTVLPLSSLIIAPDPKNSPSSVRRIEEIANRYKALGVNVTLWYNDTYIPDTKIRQDIQRFDYYITNNQVGANQQKRWYKANLDKRIKTKPQAERQCQFVTECMKEHKRNGQKWVLLTDTDEFLIYNYIHPEAEDYSRYDQSRHSHSSIDQSRNNRKPIRDMLPPLNKTTVSDFINSLETNTSNPRKSCYRIPGLRFGGHESSYKETVVEGLTHQTMQGAPHPQRLVTVAHRSHDKIRHGEFSKVMVDVSRVKEDDLKRNNCQTIHNAQLQACRSNGARRSGTDYIAAIFRIHHYQGSLESFLERAGDYRGKRSQAKYQEHLTEYDPTVTDDDIRPWLNQFVANVGPDISRALLEQ